MTPNKSWIVTMMMAALIGVTVVTSACGSAGACVGSGGSLIADVCHDDYDLADCDENNEIGLNGSSWVHHPGQTCTSLGYTEECTDTSNTFREPGAC